MKSDRVLFINGFVENRIAIGRFRINVCSCHNESLQDIGIGLSAMETVGMFSINRHVEKGVALGVSCARVCPCRQKNPYNF